MILDKFSQKLVDSGYDLGTRQEILKSGLRKSYRELAQARREGASRYRTRQQMNESKDVKNILNKPWFRRMRGGIQTKLLKEGETKDSARNKIRKVEVSRNQGGEGQERGKDCQGKVKEVECVEIFCQRKDCLHYMKKKRIEQWLRYRERHLNTLLLKGHQVPCLAVLRKVSHM